MPSPLHLPTALAYAILALGHTSKGLSQFSHPSLSTVHPQVRGAAKIGWYEGSVWFIIAGVLNYKWSVTGLVDGADRTVAGLLVALLFGAGGSVSIDCLRCEEDVQLTCA